MLNFISIYQTEFFSIIQLLTSWLFLFICAFRYGKQGVYVYIVTAVILSNLQVMKFGQFFWSEEPVALGTVVFASTFLATDILTEFYSAESAKNSVMLGFIGFAFFSLLMMLQISIPAVSTEVLEQNHLTDGHKAMVQLFTPMPILYLSSIISYFISERSDIAIYGFFKKLTKDKALWLRSIVAATISAFLDTAIFSALAWKLFAVNPVSGSTLIFTYILGSFWPRILIAITGVPVLYALKHHKARWLSRMNP
ncbi:MAG: queuosine precursor transporter [Alphaproteobacteria bacterium]|nr:queuosine precursor transporter [Alphaproteobacteria bacterium]